MPQEWFSKGGRMILVGDAAHAMPPHAAQGVGMGVEDAVLVANIVVALSQQARVNAVRPIVEPSATLWRREYQLRRQARVEHFVKHAESQGRARMDNGWAQGKLREWGLWVAYPLINLVSSIAAKTGYGPDLQGWGYDPFEEVISLEGL